MSSIATIKIGKHNDPIFFYYGRRVNLETGYNLAIRHGLINAGSYVDQWFIDNCEIKACDSGIAAQDQELIEGSTV